MMEPTDPIASILLWVTLLFFFGVLGRYIAKRFHQPGVLGELLMGVLIGNVCYFFGMHLAVILREGSVIFAIMRDLLGSATLPEAVHQVIPNAAQAQQVIDALSGPDGIDLIKIAYVVDIFSRYGIIFLLFMVGLESSLDELKHTGRASLQVACIGVLAPMLLGLVFTYLFMPTLSFKTDLFIAATLTATSVGITASVLKEMNQLGSREAQTILGAAVIDDILGLIILAIVSSIVVSGVVHVTAVLQIILLTLFFLCGTLWLGPWLLGKVIHFFEFLDPWEAKLCVAFLFVMALAWLATAVHLAAIIGAFVAGLIIHDGFFKTKEACTTETSMSIRELVAPLEAILAPLFFIVIGIQVKIETFFDGSVLLMSMGLLLAAILGKLVSGLGAKSGDNRLLIGVGMLPRGEVGLVFASIGKTLGVISEPLFAAIILMVIITTVMTPPWLKREVAL